MAIIIEASRIPEIMFWYSLYCLNLMFKEIFLTNCKWLNFYHFFKNLCWTVVMKLILWSSVWCGYILLTQPIPTPTFLLWKGSNWTEASRHSPGGHKVVVVHHLDKCLHLGPVLDFLFAHSSCDFSREAINPSHQTVSIGLVLCTVIVVLQHKHQHLQLCFI